MKDLCAFFPAPGAGKNRAIRSNSSVRPMVALRDFRSIPCAQGLIRP
jgi:hypothetical protein